MSDHLPLDAYWMPYTGNRQFKRDPRIIVEAKEAQTKLKKEAFKIRQKLSEGSPYAGQLKDAMLLVDENVRELEHMLDWGEFPNGAKFTKDAMDHKLNKYAKETVDLAEKVSAAKGVLLLIILVY